MTCDHIYWFDHAQTYKNCKRCDWKGELRLKSIQHDDFKADAEIEAEEKTTVQELVDKAVANPNDDTGEEKVEATVEEQRAEYWDQQTRIEEGLDHKGGLTNDELAADAEMQEMKTEEIIEEREKEDEPEMPEGGWECSECGAPVDNMNDVCSRGCFNAMMR